jgi:glutaminyl-peptide cyclotransferase
MKRPILKLITAALLCCISGFLSATTPAHFDGARALEYTRQFASIGPRWVGGNGHRQAEDFLRKQFSKDQLQDDSFVATTPEGAMPMHNLIVRFPGKKNGVIVLATHYETNYPLRNVNFVGANDGAATTGLLLELANHFSNHTLDGYSVWLVFFDGEEAFQSWSRTDSTYGSRHLAAKWQNDGTLKRIKGFLLADMLGDKDLDIDRDTNSTPWLLDLVKEAATHAGYQSHFFARENTVDDDHIPFVLRGVPCVDIIDIDYGPNNSYHHTVQDSMDKLSSKSLTIAGDTILETIRLLNQR